jgi:2-oxoisovalerate dehydrogenase E2 component (dihydrolipoyl transacylase)
MATVFELPDLGEGLQDAEIVAWHVGVGDHVVTSQPLVSVETDKALVEVPSPHSGRVAKLFVMPGDVVEVGAPLVELESGPGQDKGTVVGELDSHVERVPTGPQDLRHEVKAAPAVRRLAQQLGIDLTTIDGTGPGGAITRADLESMGAAGLHATKLRGVRRSMFKNMTRAGRTVVHATVTDEADINAWLAGTDTTVRLIRAVAAGCRASPSLNAWFDEATEERTLHAHLDLGIAVETDDGLFAPVIRNADSLEAADLRAGLERIKRHIERRSISRGELAGPTITLSNFGMFGGRFADLIVVPPQVAILGAGRAEPRAVAHGDEPVVHRILPLSLSFDHRVVTGAEAARFLSATVDDLEKPA